LTLSLLDYTHGIERGYVMAAQHWHAADAAAEAGISKPTLLRWIKQGRVRDAAMRDRNGWRVFDRREVARIKKEATATSKAAAR
jgi:predicted site-specific integrase-resolvase